MNQEWMVLLKLLCFTDGTIIADKSFWTLIFVVVLNVITLQRKKKNVFNVYVKHNL